MGHRDTTWRTNMPASDVSVLHHSHSCVCVYGYIFTFIMSVLTASVCAGPLQVWLSRSPSPYMCARAKKNRRRWFCWATASRARIFKSQGSRWALACGLRSSQTSSLKAPEIRAVHPARMLPTHTHTHTHWGPFGWHNRAQSPRWTYRQLRLISDWKTTD